MASGILWKTWLTLWFMAQNKEIEDEESVEHTPRAVSIKLCFPIVLR